MGEINMWKRAGFKVLNLMIGIIGYSLREMIDEALQGRKEKEEAKRKE